MSLMGAYCLGLVIAGEAGGDLTPIETKIAVGMVYYRRAEFKRGEIDSMYEADEFRITEIKELKND